MLEHRTWHDRVGRVVAITAVTGLLSMMTTAGSAIVPSGDPRRETDAITAAPDSQGPAADGNATSRVVAGEGSAPASTSIAAGLDPTGGVDRPVGVPQGLRLSGWASDADTTSPVSVRLEVAASGVSTTVTASEVRPDRSTAIGFDTVLPLAPGTHEVCVTALNVGPGVDAALGCTSGTVIDQSPTGVLEAVTDTGTGGLSVAGWATDPDATSGVDVRVVVTGASVSQTLRADASRAVPAGSGRFTGVITLDPGTYELCVTALNAGFGTDTPLGCTSATVLDRDVQGNVEAATAVDSGIRISGWAGDPDAAGAPLTVRVTVAGSTHDLTADQPRPDLVEAFPHLGATTGFSRIVEVPAGTYEVCATGLNVGAGADKVFECRSVTVAEALPAATAPLSLTLTPMPIVTCPAPARPGATNTGVPAGTVLRVHEGDLTITTPGTVIDSMDIRGFVRVKAADVTIKNSIIRGKPGLTSYMSLIQAGDLGPRLTVVDSELVAANPSPFVDGIVGKQFTLRRVNIHGVIDQVKITGDNVLIEDSWLHDSLYYLQDPNYGYTPTHDDNIQIQRGNNITVRNTVMEDTHNAAMMITQDSGVVSNVVWDRNWADGGACTVNIAEKSYGPISGLKFTDNTFGLNTRIARCAILMPATTKSLSTVTGNLFTDGTSVAVSRG